MRAPADGYTLLATDAAASINATLYDNLSFNFVRDIALVGMATGPLVIAVHPSVPVKTVPEFIAYAKANPGGLTFGSSGNGSPLHLAGELFKMMTGIEMTHVPYRGAATSLACVGRDDIHPHPTPCLAKASLGNPACRFDGVMVQGG